MNALELRLAAELSRLRQRLASEGPPAPHAWVEVGDRVHDPTQGEFRRVWPRELYYHVFHATRRAA